MELFHGAKAVRLRSQHNKYLIADDDEETVRQARSTATSRNVRWEVEFVDGKTDTIRLKSRHTSKYLCASDEPFLLGLTGKRVVQASPRLKLDPTIEWEPVSWKGSSSGVMMVKLRSRKSGKTFLRGNGTLPPWKNSVTHDGGSSWTSVTQDWFLWEVEILENDHSQSQSHHLPQSPVTVPVSTPKKDLAEEFDRGSSSYRVENVDGSRESSASSKSMWSELDSSEDHHGVTVSSPGVARSVTTTCSSSKFQQDVGPIARAGSIDSDGTSPAASMPSVHKYSPRHLNSFANLKSVLEDVQKLLDGSDHQATGEAETTRTTAINPRKPSRHEVHMAKQTLNDLKYLDFKSVDSCLSTIHKAISVLYNSDDPKLRNNSSLHDLRLQIETLRDDYYSANNYLNQYTAFLDDKSNVMSELQKDVAKARELESRNEVCNRNLTTAYAKKAELLRQLEEVQKSMKEVEKSIEEDEKARAENDVEIEHMILLIKDRSEVILEMESKDKMLQYKKCLAGKRIKQVEEDWEKIKLTFSHL